MHVPQSKTERGGRVMVIVEKIKVALFYKGHAQARVHLTITRKERRERKKGKKEQERVEVGTPE